MTETQFNEMTIRANADLFALWTKVIGPGDVGLRSLWLVFLDNENRTLPVTVPIDDIPAEPDTVMIRNLSKIVRDLISSGNAASVVTLLARPGTDTITAGDRLWAAALRREFTDWPIHLATRNRIQVFAPDDLVAAS